MWQSLVGTPGYAAGTAGTVTVPKGAVLIQVIAHSSAANATLTIFGGAAIPIVNGAPPTEIRFNHTLWQSQNDAASAGSQDLVFTNTDAYFVHWVKQANA